MTLSVIHIKYRLHFHDFCIQLVMHLSAFSGYIDILMSLHACIEHETHTMESNHIQHLTFLTLFYYFQLSAETLQIFAS